MASVFSVQVTVEFESAQSREDFIKAITHYESESDDAVIKIKKYFVRHTNCVKCGIPRHMGTLGSGLMGNPGNQCRSAYWSQCERRQERLESEYDVVPPS